MQSAKSAMVQALLNGHSLNVKNCFRLFGVTNCAREITRLIEQPFGVSITRIRKEGKTKFGAPCTWMDYKLEYTIDNQAGIERMKDFLGKLSKPKVKPDDPTPITSTDEELQEFLDDYQNEPLPELPSALKKNFLQTSLF